MLLLLELQLLLLQVGSKGLRRVTRCLNYHLMVEEEGEVEEGEVEGGAAG